MTAMRILVAGAGGAVGRRLVPLLLAEGHEVAGTTRTTEGAERLRAAGIRPFVLDAFDRDAVVSAFEAARPEVVIHQLTDLGGTPGLPLSDEQKARTAQLRSIGTEHLVAASLAVGARRLIAQSLALLYLPGKEPHTEHDPLGVSEPWMAITLPGVVALERTVTGEPRLEGFVLRYGLLYGPGAGTEEPDGTTTVHVDGAARAAVLAIDRGEPGIYNIVDDGGPVSNAKARSGLGWRPERPEVGVRA